MKLYNATNVRPANLQNAGIHFTLNPKLRVRRGNFVPKNFWRIALMTEKITLCAEKCIKMVSPIGKKIICWKKLRFFWNCLFLLVRGDERVIRSCGYEEKFSSDGEKRECYNTVLEEYNTYVCTCEGDGCNGSANIKFSIFSIVCTTILAMFFK